MYWPAVALAKTKRRRAYYGNEKLWRKAACNRWRRAVANCCETRAWATNKWKENSATRRLSGAGRRRAAEPPAGLRTAARKTADWRLLPAETWTRKGGEGWKRKTGGGGRACGLEQEGETIVKLWTMGQLCVWMTEWPRQEKTWKDLCVNDMERLYCEEEWPRLVCE